MSETTGKDMDAPTQGSLAARLRELTLGKSAIDVGQFRFIGMDKIAASYGATWQKNRTEALDTAHGILLKRIGPKDLIARGDDGFLVIRGGVSEADAEQFARTVSAVIDEHFLGAPVKGGSAAADAAATAESEGEVDFFGPDTVSVDTSPLTSFDWRFQPVWDVKREALGVWHLAPFLKGQDDPVPGYAFDTFDTNHSAFEAIDEASIQMSERAIRKLMADGRKAIVSMSIHVSSLTAGGPRTRLLTAIERGGQDISRYRLIKLAGITPGFPRMYLGEIMGALKARTPNVAIGAAWTEPDLPTLISAGPSAIGFVLSKTVVADTANKPHADLLTRIRQAVQTAHAARKPFLIEGVFNRALAREIAALGVDGMSSPKIWTPASLPSGVERWSASRLLSI